MSCQHNSPTYFLEWIDDMHIVYYKPVPCDSNSWRPFCEGSGWGVKEASVACTELGYSYGTPRELISNCTELSHYLCITGMPQGCHISTQYTLQHGYGCCHWFVTSHLICHPIHAHAHNILIGYIRAQPLEYGYSHIRCEGNESTIDDCVIGPLTTQFCHYYGAIQCRNGMYNYTKNMSSQYLGIQNIYTFSFAELGSLGSKIIMVIR